MTLVRSALKTEVPVVFKAHVIREFRRLLCDRGFLEVSTPVIRRHEGGALTPRLRLSDGRLLRESPAFALRYNLRHVPKAFEIGVCFRPDPVDATHLQEFSMLDLYWRDAALDEVVPLAQDLVGLFYDGPIEHLSFAEHLKSELDVDMFGDPEGEMMLRARLAEMYVSADMPFPKLLDRYVKTEIEPLSKGKCLVVRDFPFVIESRAGRKAGARCVADRVEFQIDGVEVVHAYTDEPNPERLRTCGEAQGNFGPEDEVMCQLLASGEVPGESSGFGIGIERLCQVCTGAEDIGVFMASRPFAG